MNLKNVYFLVKEHRDLGGIDSFFEECVSLIAQDEVIALFFSKLETSNDFSSFFEKIGKGDFEQVLSSLRTSRDLQHFIFKLKMNGIDLIKWFQVLKTFFGFGANF